MESVDAAVHDWPLATYDEKVETDTNYKRLLDWALRPRTPPPSRSASPATTSSTSPTPGHLAKTRGWSRARVDFEMLLGMATAQADGRAGRRRPLLLYTPVVHPHEFDSAISYLVRRLEENASSRELPVGSLRPRDRRRRSSTARRGRFLRRRSRRRSTTGCPGRTAARTARGASTSATISTIRRLRRTQPDTDPSLESQPHVGRDVLRAARALRRWASRRVEEAWVDDRGRLEDDRRRRRARPA